MTEDSPGGMAAHTIPPVVDDVYPHTVRARFQADPGFAAAETGLLRRNGIDPQRVLIDTYERHGADVAYQYAVLDPDGKRIIAADPDDPDGVVVVTSDVAGVLAVYP